jgi:hypothetical protein
MQDFYAGVLTIVTYRAPRIPVENNDTREEAFSGVSFLFTFVINRGSYMLTY